jgi:hypothetical protein
LVDRLDKLTKGKWHAALDDCPGSGRQHVGFLYDESRVQVSHAKDAPGLNPGKDACDKNLRPGFGMYAKFRDGPDLNLVSVHFDSGSTDRDLENRQSSLDHLANVAKTLGDAEKDTDLLVLGDFNVMGCPQCSPALDATAELDQIDKKLEPIALRRLPLPKKTQCTEYGSKAGSSNLLDLVLASTQMEEVAADASLQLYGICGDLKCKPPYKAEHPAAFDRLSDHCPVVIQLGATDADPPPPGKAVAAKAAPAPAAAAAKVAPPKEAAAAAAAAKVAPPKEAAAAKQASTN